MEIFCSCNNALYRGSPSVLAAATLATQSYIDVERRGSTIPVSNYFVTIADSGERKTSVDQNFAGMVISGNACHL